MKKSDIVLGALTIFDSAVVGKRWFRLVIALHKINSVEKKALIEYLIKHPNMLWVGEVGGNWDLVLNFVVSDQFEFNHILENFLEKWGKYILKYRVLVYINVRDQARRYILPNYETKQTELFHTMKQNPNIKLDELDKQLIKLLTKNAWGSFSSFATKLGVNYKTVQERIKKLEEYGLILGYRLIVHPQTLGYKSYMIFLATCTYDSKTEKRLYEFLKHPNVTYVVKHLGYWKIGIEAEFKSSEDYQNFLFELRAQFSGIIAEYDTFPILRDHAMNYFPDGALQ